MMRVRLLDEDWARVRVALDDSRWHDEGVEATTPPGETVSSSQPVGKIKTCPACGSTGAVGSLFYVSNPTYCKPCTSRKINDHIHRVNEATRDTAENHRQPWSELEVETLLTGLAEGMSGRDLAELLGRTYLAVHGKIEAIRKLLAEGQEMTYATYEVTTTVTKVTIRPANVCPKCHLVRPCFCD